MRFFGRAAKFLPFGLAIVAIIGLFLLIRLDWIVNNLLYNYGLNFSNDWVIPYQFVLRSSLVCLGIVAVVASILSFILLKAEHKYTPEKKAVPWKAKRFFNYKKNIIVIILFASAGSLGIASTILDSVALVLAVLGLTIWGTILLLATTQKVVKVNLASLHMANSTFTCDSLLSRFGYSDYAIIDPPKTIGDNPSLQISRKGEKMEKTFFTPLGLDLAFLIEKKSPVDLFSLEFDVLSEFLSKMLTEEFELASGFSMSRKNDQIHVRMADFIFQDLCRQIEKSSPTSCRRLLCPICSSLACIISKATHSSISLEAESFISPNVIEICFRTREPKSA